MGGENGVVALLTKAYSKRAEGGGFANFDVPALFDELQGIQNPFEVECGNGIEWFLKVQARVAQVGGGRDDS